MVAWRSCMQRRTRLGLTAIVVVAAIARFWGLSFGLPHTNARPDETIIIDQVALTFLRGNLSPHFYDYPWLLMWVLAGLYLFYYAFSRIAGSVHSLSEFVASWKFHWAPFFLIARGLSAVMG